MAASTQAASQPILPLEIQSLIIHEFVKLQMQTLPSGRTLPEPQPVPLKRLGSCRAVCRDWDSLVLRSLMDMMVFKIGHVEHQDSIKFELPNTLPGPKFRLGLWFTGGTLPPIPPPTPQVSQPNQVDSNIDVRFIDPGPFTQLGGLELPPSLYRHVRHVFMWNSELLLAMGIHYYGRVQAGDLNRLLSQLSSVQSLTVCSHLHYSMQEPTLNAADNTLCENHSELAEVLGGKRDGSGQALWPLYDALAHIIPSMVSLPKIVKTWQCSWINLNNDRESDEVTPDYPPLLAVDRVYEVKIQELVEQEREHRAQHAQSS